MKSLVLLTLCFAQSVTITPANTENPYKIKISEAYRKETLTTHSGGITESQTASRGKLTMTGEYPYAPEGILANDKANTILIQVGNFARKFVFGDNPNYRPNTKTLKIPIKERFEKQSRRIVGTLSLRFEARKCFVKLEAQIPDAGLPASAEAAVGGGAGEAQIETSVFFSVGPTVYVWKTVLKGKVREQHAGNPDQFGQVLSATLKN